MILPLAALALGFVVVFFLTQRRQYDETWQRFRKRHQERLRHAPPEQVIDPNFQFDQTGPDDGDEDRRCARKPSKRGRGTLSWLAWLGMRFLVCLFVALMTLAVLYYILWFVLGNFVLS